MTAVLDATPTTQPAGRNVVPEFGRGPGPFVAVLATGSLLAVLVSALLVGGGAPAPATPGLPTVGPVVGWGQPVVQLLTRVFAVLVVGSLLVAAALRPAPGGVLPVGSRRAIRTAAAGAAGWGACEVAGLVLLTGSLLGLPVTGLAPGDVAAVATALPAGRSVLAVVVLLVVLALLGVVAAGARSTGAVQARVLLLTAVAAVVLPVVTTGHSAAAGDHLATVSALAVHVVAASLWTGGLLGVLLHLRGAGADRAVAVHRLSRLALGCVVAVTVTGVASALLVTDVGLSALLGSGYGALLLVKTLAVALLVWVGWEHRRRTLPLLRAGAHGAFVRLAVVETGLMAATLAVAVGLSAAPPPAASAAEAPAPAADPQTQSEGVDGAAADSAAADSAATDSAAVDSAAVDSAAADSAATDSAAVDSAAAGDRSPAVDPPPASLDVPPAEDMAAHDHGELSVTVLVDDERLHLGAPVRPGVLVTVYNSGAAAVVLRAEDGSFDTVVPPRTFITFTAPQEPGGYAFGDPGDARYADVLQVAAPQG